MRLRCFLVAALAALLIPVAAHAKGASEATVTGPGLDKPLFFGGGEQDGTAVMGLVESAGFFPAVFSQTPDPMLKDAPPGPLGPKYTIHYVVPGNNGRGIEQDVYPYAKPTPITYMRPGQPMFDGKTIGGWYAAPPALKQQLVAKGLPRHVARTAALRKSRTTGWIIGGALAAVAAVGGVGYWRRK